ncbi:hypothetical protein B0H10DRAFT_509338 [Mycena sp. CBHHK59/15]|nr:hypothetical protein B0H10DRAFT_509338 [Mycena sp. CBHHK59/15]
MGREDIARGGCSGRIASSRASTPAPRGVVARIVCAGRAPSWRDPPSLSVRSDPTCARTDLACAGRAQEAAGPDARCPRGLTARDACVWLRSAWVTRRRKDRGGGRALASVVKVRFSPVQSHFFRTPNLNFGPVRGICRTPNLNLRFRFIAFGSAFKGVRTGEPNPLHRKFYENTRIILMDQISSSTSPSPNPSSTSSAMRGSMRFEAILPALIWPLRYADYSSCNALNKSMFNLLQSFVPVRVPLENARSAAVEEPWMAR